MPKLSVPALPGGERMARANYREEFRSLNAAIRGESSWKLERRQHFEEINNASRDAFFRDGEVARSLRLLEERREALREALADDESRDARFHRVRIVEEPFTPYMRWQLHSLRVRAECGDRIRMVSADAVAAYETRARLPELVALGGSVLYQVMYTDSGRPDGAIRYCDPEVIGSWEYFISQLYASGEDVREFIQRKPVDLTAEFRRNLSH